MLPLLACVAFAGCIDPPARADVAHTRMLDALTCTVTPHERRFVCTPSSGTTPQVGERTTAPSGAGVLIAGANLSLDTLTHVFQAEVTVRNLLGTPLGTPDGTTVSGVKVFYFAGPTVTAYMAPGDTGTVTVRNADSTGNFTSARQPYYLYDQILQPNATSAPKLWQWTYPRTVKSFSFQVKVFAATPGEVLVPVIIPEEWQAPSRYRSPAYLRECDISGMTNCVYDAVTVMFFRNASQEERQAAVDAVNGVLEGGNHSISTYYLRIPGDSTFAGLRSALTKLRSLPQVRIAAPYGDLPLDFTDERPLDGPNWDKWQVRDSLADGSNRRGVER